jgi:two-component sensor histidine kinase
VRSVALPLDATVTQELSLVLHELATNAAKHGALLAPAGRILIEAGPVERSHGSALRLVWREEGGPPVTAPSRQGFGTRLLGQLFARRAGGSLELDWRREGLICRIELPLAMAA